MAKVIRSRWVFRKDNKWIRYLPRRHDGVIKEHDYDKFKANREDFVASLSSEDLLAEPPKLWLAWLYRDLTGEPKWTKARVAKLFGSDPKPGRMEVFPNTPSYNDELWPIKHLIELRPMTFPKGEPLDDDISRTEIKPDGTCTIADSSGIDITYLSLTDEAKKFTSKQLNSQLNRKYARYEDVFESNVYTPAKISLK